MSRPAKRATVALRVQKGSAAGYPTIVIFPFDSVEAVLFEGELLVKPCRTPEATGRRIAAALRAVGPGFIEPALHPPMTAAGVQRPRRKHS